jgi:hypothetical protein
MVEYFPNMHEAPGFICSTIKKKEKKKRKKNCEKNKCGKNETNTKTTIILLQ